MTLSGLFILKMMRGPRGGKGLACGHTAGSGGRQAGRMLCSPAVPYIHTLSATPPGAGS